MENLKNENKNLIKNFDDKVIVITGGDSKIGFELVKKFGGKGAKVIIASRTYAKAKKSQDKLNKKYPNMSIEIIQVDLGCCNSIEKFVETFKSKYTKIDFLINNADLVSYKKLLTNKKLEANVGINHFGHFILTLSLLDVLKSTSGSKVINVSNDLYKNIETLDFEKFNDEMIYENWSWTKQYSISKLMTLLFTHELNKRIKEKKYDIGVIAIDYTKRNAKLYNKDKLIAHKIKSEINNFSFSTKKRAHSVFELMINKDLTNGEFLCPKCNSIKDIEPIAKDDSLAKELWERSENISNFKFNI